MKYIEYCDKIHCVYADTKEFLADGYQQKKPIDYLKFIEEKPYNTVNDLLQCHFKVGKWIAIWTGKNQGIMRVLSIRKKKTGVDNGLFFETCFGWAQIGQREIEFDPTMWHLVQKKLKPTPREYNFAASFALTGDLRRAYVNNINNKVRDEDSGFIPKKKPLPYLLTPFQIPLSGKNLTNSICHVTH